MYSEKLIYSPSIELDLPAQEHLVLLHNIKATNGNGRDDEIRELTELERWASCARVKTSKDNNETIAALVNTLRSLEAQAKPGDRVTVLAIGGDKTADNGIQGIDEAKLETLTVEFGAASAGNKSDTAVNLGTAGLTLREIVEKGEPTDVYPLNVTATVDGASTAITDRKTLHSVGGVANEFISSSVNETGFPKGSKLHEAWVTLGGLWRAFRRPANLVENNIGLKNGKTADFMVMADGEIAGGAVRAIDTALTDPNRLTVLHTRRRLPNMLGGLATRPAGLGPEHYWVQGGELRMTFRGLEQIQMGGDGHRIHDGNGGEQLVTLTISRADPVRVLTFKR